MSVQPESIAHRSGIEAADLAECAYQLHVLYVMSDTLRLRLTRQRGQTRYLSSSTDETENAIRAVILKYSRDRYFLDFLLCIN